MSKKSYKRNQNRLYREIKRRMVLEHMIKRPVPIFREYQTNVETIKIRYKFPYYGMMMDYAKEEMVKKIAQKLYADHYITFNKRSWFPDDYLEIEARLDVLRPKEKGEEQWY